MGRYFGRQPRYSREELERQAQEAIDARISLGRPPAEDFLPVEKRLAVMDRAAALGPPVKPSPGPQPLRIHHLRPPAGTREPAPPKAARQPVAAARSASTN